MFGNLEHATLRYIAFANHLMILISSTIVTGLVSWFLHKYDYRGVNIVYQEVIATITLGFWLVGAVLPLIGRYRGYLAPMNLVFSYLWLTSFIFSSQDWSSGKCGFGKPGEGHCSRKKAIDAFNFIGFFFLLCNTIVEGILLRAEYATPAAAPHNKEISAGRPSDNSV
ncbi:hypothetical protein TsFJ059_001507 [Trichoderma semiorbis]|uniref:MARVEL domain-containing protein n=6 Tax=Trichoderma TaxID=5543 RepID=A0A2T4AL13_TRIHA|nr:hypothetical protein M431DRAFT_78687 [Trichoderma harzianum CBS 226.95]KAF3077495.1 hypothetical protein CFAM422_000385 [Trichoderma lentiforme]KAH0532873.1 hypothetical protein TsFJ059_001507 [Trichoderma semiorbis]KAK0760291.1 hypothetical protein N5P37_007374 [Trichoderma harzianum]OPB37174.1 hypothetical protein A0O28_0040860 [Trichoderma guizhouense]QYS94605.1 hypothetical protein H0G86_001935 [Trichoderma simmonsii]